MPVKAAIDDQSIYWEHKLKEKAYNKQIVAKGKPSTGDWRVTKWMEGRLKDNNFQVQKYGIYGKKRKKWTTY